ncbi:hypothetical protein D6779_10150 [Candidatus Parcubacteria bacterium]|nr:MAG: hypothetical protein D6779_10150 [Candidatus Parcubacteria bacterium]
MTSLESQIKQQFARIFNTGDWSAFKLLAEYYLRTATRLRKRDVDIGTPYKLLARNAQKRLFIGVGCELLVKAFFLKQGYGINKIDRRLLEERSLERPQLPYQLGAISSELLIDAETFSFNQVLAQLGRIAPFNEISRKDRQVIMRGFKIAKVFRNKEGHIATLWHTFDPSNYSDIENALILFYRVGFGEQLEIQFSVERNEPDRFVVNPLS